MSLYHDTLKIAEALPRGDRVRRELLETLRFAALPKVPGISPRFLAEMVEKAKLNVVGGLTDSYGNYGELGSEWVAEWKATAIGGRDHHVHGEYYKVEEATFVGAYNSGSLEVWDHWDKITPRHHKSADLDMAASVVAQAIKGTWRASAWFGWTENLASVEKVGDTFDSTGDTRAFERATVEGAASWPGVHAAEYPITVKVQRVSIRKDGSFRVTASFSA
jgi:hypothetical protein